MPSLYLPSSPAPATGGPRVKQVYAACSQPCPTDVPGRPHLVQGLLCVLCVNHCPLDGTLSSTLCPLGLLQRCLYCLCLLFLTLSLAPGEERELGLASIRTRGQGWGPRLGSDRARCASFSSCSARCTSPTVRARIVSTSARLRTRSAISPAKCRICSGDAGMESSSTRVATNSMLSGSAPSSMGTQARA